MSILTVSKLPPSSMAWQLCWGFCQYAAKFCRRFFVETMIKSMWPLVATSD